MKFLLPDLPGLRESHPQDEDELEGVVEGCCLSIKRKNTFIHEAVDLRNQ